MSRKANKNRGSSLDDLLIKEGVFEQFQAKAIKEVIAWQLVEEMKEQNLSKAETIESLQRAAKAVGRTLQIRLAS